MQDWNKLIADENKIIGRHYTAGRDGHKIKFIVIHHNGGNLSIADCFSVWQTRKASAHYQVQGDGRIGQLVHDADTAWHAGNLQANYESIGIEHADAKLAPDWTVSDATLDNGAHLVAAICKYYGLGRPSWGGNVFPHHHFTSTDCPGALDGSQRDAYISKAQAYYDQMTGTSAPAAAPAVNDVFNIDTDGLWGSNTTRALQSAFGTPNDGIISSQATYNRQFLLAATTGWEWVANNAAKGSQLIAAIQQQLKNDNQYGGNIDGLAGTQFASAICLRFNGVRDTRLDNPSQAVQKMQQRLRDTHKF